MSSQYQRSDLVEGLALFVESPIAEVGDAVSGQGMTVAFELAHNRNVISKRAQSHRSALPPPRQ